MHYEINAKKRINAKHEYGIRIRMRTSIITSNNSRLAYGHELKLISKGSFAYELTIRIRIRI